jgi:hypothetical protein
MSPARTFSRYLAAVVVAISAAHPSRAQSTSGAVLAKLEPHHHLVYEDSTIRVLRVRVPPHDTTLLHEHDPDYFWISLGPSTLINVRPGTPDASVSSADRAFHYAVGPFAHIARNPGSAAFDNITVELLEPQRHVHNLCEAAVADMPLTCRSSPGAPAFFTGAAEHPAFATSNLRVSLLTIAPGATLRPAKAASAMWVIALDTVDTKHALLVVGGPRWVGGTFRAAKGERWTVRNAGSGGIQVIGVVKD